MTRTPLLRQREFGLFFAGQTVSLLGDGMIRVALPFAVLAVGGSAAEVGLVLAARMLPMVACLLIGGVVADRVSRRAVMVTADLVRVASQGVLAVLLIAGQAEVWSLAALSAVGGAATGFFNPAMTGLTPSVVAPADLQRANGMRGTAQAIGEIAGPVVAGILVAGVGAGWAMAADALTFAVSAVCLGALRLPAQEEREATSFVTDMREGWTAFMSHRWVWTLVFSVSFGAMFWGAWSALGPVVAENELGGAEAWGTILGAAGVGGVVGGIAAIRLEPRRPMVTTVFAFGLFSLPLAFLAAGASVPLLAMSSFVSGLGMVWGNAIWEATLQRHVEPESLSRVSAYDWFGSMVLNPVGLALWGPIGAAIGITTALWIAFAGVFLFNLALLAVPEIRQLRGQ